MTSRKRSPGSGNVRERGPGRWEIRAPLPPDPVTGRRKIHSETIRGDKRTAERRLRAVLTEIDQGTRVAPGWTTVREFLLESIEAWHSSGRISARTYEDYRAIAEAYVIKHLGHVELTKLDTRIIEAWHVTLRQKGGRRGGVSARTIGHAHRLVVQMLGRAEKHNLVPRNVARLEKPPKIKAAEMRILTADEIDQTLARLEGDSFHLPVLVTLFTGLRRSELLALKWRHVDLDGAVLQVDDTLEELRDGSITVKRPKTDAGIRKVSLPAVVVDALRQHRVEQLERAFGRARPDLLFPGTDGGYQSPRAFSMRWCRTVARLGLPDIHWHTTRHTHVSMLIDAKIDIVMLAKRVGHAGPDVTLRVYAHLFRKDDRAVAEAIDLALFSRR
jgi:integrase